MNERSFEYRDAASSKFWAISVTGDSHTVRFGKIGTNGQTKTKSFATAQKAQVDADKLIAEKTGKGYTETTASGATATVTPTVTTSPVSDSQPAKKPSARKSKALATQEPEPVAAPSPPPPLAATTPAVAIELSPEDFLWVTYGDRPHFEPTKAGPLTTAQFLAKLTNPEKLITKPSDWRHPFEWLDELRTTTIPRLTEAEREEARDILRPQVDLVAWMSRVNDDVTPPEFALAATLGMHAEIEAVVASWANGSQSYSAGHFPYNLCYPAMLVLALGSKAKVIAEARRLSLYLNRPEHIAGWLAHTGTEALDAFRDTVLATGTKDDTEKMLREFCRVKTAAAAPFMLELMLDSKAPALARTWFTQNPSATALGLAKAAPGKGKLADAAKELFAELKAKGQVELIRAAIAAHPEAANVLTAILEQEAKTYPVLPRSSYPADLQKEFAALPKKSSLPDFISVVTLPPILIDGQKLDDTDVTAMLGSFRAQKGEIRPPLAKVLKTVAEPRSLDSLTWALYQSWAKAGFPSKEKWCFLTCGWLGGDNTARQLTPLIREWPGQSQHQRAKTGLEVLRMIGTDIALTMLNGIAQKLKFAALKQRARDLMDLISTDRGMSRPELEDRIVPDLDLDAKGERIFDYGPRQFRLVIGPDYKPRVKGPDDKVKDKLPPANKNDDAEKVKLANDDWKAFTKVLKGVLDLQRARLEQGMVTLRRWNLPDFLQFLVKHPVMTHLARRLVWGQYTNSTTVKTNFRVTEEGEFTDATDKPLTLDASLTIGIVHPMQLKDSDRQAWGQLLGDYEIIPPFEQLGRPIHKLDLSEHAETDLRRFANSPANAGKVWGFMEKRGWDRGSSSDHGVVMEFAKWYPSANVTAVIDIEPGIARGMLDMLSSDQTITGCYFVPGHYNPVAYNRATIKLALGQVDPVAISETLHDLYRLTAKE